MLKSCAMSYRVENSGDCTKRLLFNLENVDLSPQIDQALQEKQKSSNLKGFRKGKAPLSVIRQIYGQDVEAHALHSLISQQLMEALQKEEIRAVGMPKVADTKYDKDQALSFEAIVEYIPEVTIKDYTHFTFTQDDTAVSKDDAKAVMARQLDSKAQMVEVKDATLAKGHFAVINFQGTTEEGESPENMKGEEFVLEIGPGSFIPGFEDALVGMKAGDQKDVPLTFPDDYHQADLQKSKVTFAVELLEIKTQEIPVLTDALAKDLGYTSKDDMQAKIKSNLQYQRQRAAQEKLHQQILDQLIEENQFEVPQALIEDQEKSLRENLSGELQRKGFGESQAQDYFTKWASDLKEKAIFQVRSGLILNTLAQEHSIEVTDQDLDAKYDEMAQQSGLTREEIQQYYSQNEDIVKNLCYAIQEEKTFAQICKKIKIT